MVISDIVCVLENLKGFRNWIQQNKLERNFEAYQITLDNLESTGELNKFLEFYYKEDMDKFYQPTYGEITTSYPLFTLDQWIRPSDKLDSLLSRSSDIDTYSSVFDKKYIDRLQERKVFYSKTQDRSVDMSRALFNGRTFQLTKIQGSSLPQLEFRSSDYFSYLSMCESRTDELIMKSYSLRKEDTGNKFRFLKKKLDLRNGNASSFDVNGDLSNHFWKLGINVLTVFQSKGTYYIPISKRSNFLAEFPGRYHVVPAGTFQPASEINQTYEFKLSHTIYREYMEEIFGKKKLIKPDSNLPPTWFYESDELKPVLNSIKSGDSFLYYTGFGIDALAYKPELSCLLFINDKNYLDNFGKQMTGCWEFAGICATDESRFLDINDQRILEILQPRKIIPAGAMAIVEGLKTLKEKHGITSIVFQ